MIFRKEYQRHRLKGHFQKRQRQIGFSDLLTYWLLLGPNTLWHKDGAFSQHYRLQGPDLASATSDALDAHSQTWQEALSLFGNGWMVETQVFSQPLYVTQDAPHYPDRVSSLMADERRLLAQSGHYYQTQTFLSVTWKSSSAKHSIVASQPDATKLLPQTFENPFIKFKQRLAEFTGILSRSFKVTPLSVEATMTYLHQAITGLTHTIGAPSTGVFLDGYLGSQDFVAGFKPKIGNATIQVLALDTLPSVSYPALLDSLNTLPLPYRWASRYVCLDKPCPSGKHA